MVWSTTYKETRICQFICNISKRPFFECPATKDNYTLHRSSDSHPLVINRSKSSERICWIVLSSHHHQHQRRGAGPGPGILWATKNLWTTRDDNTGARGLHWLIVLQMMLMDTNGKSFSWQSENRIWKETFFGFLLVISCPLVGGGLLSNASLHTTGCEEEEEATYTRPLRRERMSH